MELRDCKIGVRIQDQTLRRMLSNLLWRNGAVVCCTESNEEIGLDLVIGEVKVELFCRN